MNSHLFLSLPIVLVLWSCGKEGIWWKDGSRCPLKIGENYETLRYFPNSLTARINGHDYLRRSDYY